MKYIFKVFILSLFLSFFSNLSASTGLYSENFPEPLDIMPRETILFDGISQYAEFVFIIRPFDNRRYRIRTGIGCLRTFLDPQENIEMELRGYGKFWVSKKEGYPFLHVKTDYHKVMCKITEINPA